MMKNLDSNSSKLLDIAMFPWFAFGHFIPFLHLSNKLAEKGHKISFLLPKGIQPKLEQINQYPNLIQFFPLLVPHVEGLPPAAESTAGVPPRLQKYLAMAFDGTHQQVEAILSFIKPDLVFYDFGHWVPALARQLGFKSVFYGVVSTMSLSIITKKVTKEMTVEELLELPPAYPCPAVNYKSAEADRLLFKAEPFGDGLTFQERITTSMKQSDALAFRTYREIEGPFCDYLSKQHHGKSVLLTGPCLPETKTKQLEEKWVDWLSKFEPKSVVFCSFGSQSILQKDEFQELLLGFELSGLPFLVALTPPQGCTTVEEALPQGFEERVGGSGLVYGGWVPQELLLKHPSIGCFVNHCGYGTMWEFLLSDCQIVLIPEIPDQMLNTRLMVNELKVAVEVERGENKQISKEDLSQAIKLVMDEDSEIARVLKSNRAKLKETLAKGDLQEQYIDNFIQGLQDLIK
ncbi:UDP-glucuronosyl/UDP-glucosyltransferase [Corchorus capsularis]|uniref:UDP-glucuronosyl/UDP-glucosyltransferase n=1 Tax=Corchorus capsularis TaxID=210143 RepID=A0A1R3HX70_COCAP|nr:UDP-glucuronosyl/UDP-glucosyltransferase [Corchorus capsularis]